jgi:alpha-tubulin suppressor-like RCC1 family protein
MDPNSQTPSADFGLYSYEEDGEKRINESVLKEFLVPKPVPLPSKKVISVACGETFVAVVARNEHNFGVVYTAGNNGFGQLGNGEASKEANQLVLQPVRDHPGRLAFTIRNDHGPLT